MEIIRCFKFKFLEQLLKRKLTKYWYFWRLFQRPRYKIAVNSKPFIPTVVIQNEKSPILKKSIKVLHRSTHSCMIDMRKSENLKSTPVIHGSKVSETIFDQIRLSLQSKAGTVDPKNALTKAETMKIKSAKKKLFVSEQSSIKHKRTSTMPDGNLAVVSSKIEKQAIFKPSSKK